MKIYGVKILDVNDKDLDKLCLFIDLEKKRRIKKFINKKDKIRTLIGDLLVRNIITKKLGITNNNIIFEKNKYGKPYLKEYENFNFNISHSGNFVVCAIDDKPIGIDIEEVKHIEYEGIAKSFFTENEFNYIMTKDVDMQLSRFYEIWTLKESYIKCVGKGLNLSLKSFCISIDKYENIKNVVDNEQNQYMFRKFHIDSDYKVSVCSLNKDIPNEIIMINQNELMISGIG